MTTLEAARRLCERTEGHIVIEIAKDTNPPATSVAVEVGVDPLEAVVEASEEIGHRTMEVRRAEK